MSPIKFDHQPKISIVTCTYNRDYCLAKCIDSVVNQTFSEWELIIVDDGSNDDTFNVIDKYLSDFNNIRYLKQKNKKQAYAKNTGIQASFGEYITFLDSDDSYLYNHLESRIKYMQANPEVDAISGGFTTDEEIFVVDYFQPEQKINIKQCVIVGTIFAKRKVFFELQGFNNLSYGEDTEFWLRVKEKFNARIISQPETYVYTRAIDSISKLTIEKNG